MPTVVPLKQTTPLTSNKQRDIFSPRVAIKPYEYPELVEYVDDIRESYWTHKEFNYQADIQDMKVNLTPEEAEAINRTMLAISQIESAVKSFWGNMHRHLPKPEIAKVGATFAESEVRHEDAYSQLLEKLGLNAQFETIHDIPAMQDRINYISKINKRARASEDPKDYFKAIIFFSTLIENVSLFSQFYIIMSFNKYKDCLKGMSNVVEATSKEENLHGQFGFDVINILKRENPEWWTQDLQDYIKEKMQKAFLAEMKVLDWVYENGDLDTAPRKVVDSFVMDRLNQSLKAIGLEEIFQPDTEALQEAKWFDEELTVTKQTDFFNKRSTAYTKRNKSFTEEDLF